MSQHEGARLEPHKNYLATLPTTIIMELKHSLMVGVNDILLFGKARQPHIHL